MKTTTMGTTSLALLSTLLLTTSASVAIQSPSVSSMDFASPTSSPPVSSTSSAPSLTESLEASGFRPCIINNTPTICPAHYNCWEEFSCPDDATSCPGFCTSPDTPWLPPAPTKMPEALEYLGRELRACVVKYNIEVCPRGYSCWEEVWCAEDAESCPGWCVSPDTKKREVKPFPTYWLKPLPLTERGNEPAPPLKSLLFTPFAKAAQPTPTPTPLAVPHDNAPPREKRLEKSPIPTPQLKPFRLTPRANPPSPASKSLLFTPAIAAEPTPTPTTLWIPHDESAASIDNPPTHPDVPSDFQAKAPPAPQPCDVVLRNRDCPPDWTCYLSQWCHRYALTCPGMCKTPAEMERIYEEMDQRFEESQRELEEEKEQDERVKEIKDRISQIFQGHRVEEGQRMMENKGKEWERGLGDQKEWLEYQQEWLDYQTKDLRCEKDEDCPSQAFCSRGMCLFFVG